MAYKMGLLIALVVLVSAVGGSDGLHPRDEEIINAHPASSMFFFMDELYEGSRLRMSLVPATVPPAPFAPRSGAGGIPMSLESLPLALKSLGIPEGSEMADAMAMTLNKCKSMMIEGENRFCAGSLESLVDNVTSIIGPRLDVLATKFISKGTVNAEMQEYTITAIPFRSKPTSRSVTCHIMPYPHAAFYCHENHLPKIFRVLLAGEYGNLVDEVVTCHEDTTEWAEDHIAFKVLKVKRGGAAICHCFPERHIVWIARD